MFTVEGRSAKAALRDQPEVETILRGLGPKGYRLAFRSSARQLLNSVGLSAGLSSPQVHRVMRDILGTRGTYLREAALLGELLADDESLFALQAGDRAVTVWEIRRHQVVGSLDQLCDDISSIARAQLDGRRLRGMDWSWSALANGSVPLRRSARRARAAGSSGL